MSRGLGDVYKRQVPTHVKVDLAGKHQRAVVDLRATGQDLYIQAAIGIGAVCDGLVKSAVFGLGQPVCSEGNRFVRRRRSRGQNQRATQGGMHSCHWRLSCLSIDSSDFIDTMVRGPLHCKTDCASTCRATDSQSRSITAHAAGFLSRMKQGFPQPETPKGSPLRSLLPTSIAPPFARYAHGVEIPPGARWVTTSGQLSLAADGSVPTSAEEQAALCFANITAILAEAGMTPAHTIKVSAYVTDRVHMAGYMRARDAWLAHDGPLPASTLMIVSGFTRPEFLVEVEVLAAIA